MSGTIVSLFASIDTGLLDTFGTGGVVNNAPAEFPVPSSLSNLPQSLWSIEQWSQPVALNPGNYTQANPDAYDGLYGAPTYTWTEPGTPTEFSIYNNLLSLGGGYAYSITNGSAAGEVDFFIASPDPLNPANDILSHPITVSLNAKIAQSFIQYMAGVPYTPGYVFATVDIGFTLTFDGGGGFSYGAFSGFVQIDPWTTNSNQPVSYTNGPIGQNGVTQFIDSKRFSTDPSLPLLPSDASALPETLTYNLNNYVYNALVNAFSNFSPTEQSVLLNLANWSVGSVYIGIATNNEQVESNGSLALAASISASLQLSQISITSNLNQFYDPASSIVSVPAVDPNPKIYFYDYTVGCGGEADGSSDTSNSQIQDRYIYNGADDIALTAPVGGNWEFGGGSGLTSLTALSGNNIFIASSGGSNMSGGSGADTFIVAQPIMLGSSVVDTIENFHPGDLLEINDVVATGWTEAVILNVASEGSFSATFVATNSTLAGQSQTVDLVGLTEAEIQSLEFYDQSGGNGVAISYAGTNSNTLNQIFTVNVGSYDSWTPSDLELNALVNNGTVLIDPSTLSVLGPLTGDGTLFIGADSVLNVGGPIEDSETIAFSGSNATLTLSDIDGFSSVVDGFGEYDTIDIPGLPFEVGGSVSLNSSGTLRIIENSTTVSIDLVPTGQLYFSQLYLSSDGLNGTDVSEASVPCFVRGTRIKTRNGQVRVEDLKVGEYVLNSSGKPICIKWIGKRSYRGPLASDPNIAPILIKAHALADMIPDEDLFVSPLHAINCDNWLVAAGSLVNGVSIFQYCESDELDYFHIETDTHDIILANNTPVETFLDENSRQIFENAVEYWDTYPRATMVIGVRCLPLLESGYELERLRQKYTLRTGTFPKIDERNDFIGYLEYADRKTITGWVVKKGNPHCPQTVQILSSGVVIATVVANRVRNDVRLAGFGNGHCGFSVELPAPLPALARHSISVRPMGCSDYLSGSPIILDPGISKDLLKTGGLDALLRAAVRGAETSSEVEDLSNALIRAGQRISVSHKRANLGTSSTYDDSTGRHVFRALILDENWPTSTLDAGSNAIISHVKALQELGYSVIFHATSGPPKTIEAADGVFALRELGVECSLDHEMNTEAVINSLKDRSIRLVYLHRLATAVDYMGLVKQRLKAAKIIYAVADLHHLRLERQAAIIDRPDLRIKAKEVKAAEDFFMRMADCIITHSFCEFRIIRQMIPQANVHVVTWDQFAAKEIPEDVPDPCVAFIGGAQHSPNIDAVDQLSRKILPRVWQFYESMRCLVIGSGWTERLKQSLDQRITFVGHQANIRDYLNGVTLTMAPLRFGAGVKGKVVESFAAGRPCIMSSIAAEGMRLDPALQKIICDCDDFADYIVTLHGNKSLRRSIAKSGLTFVRREFSQTTVTRAISLAINGVAMSSITESHLSGQSENNRNCKKNYFF